MEEFTRTYSIIHLDAIHQNIETVRRKVGADTKIMAIVKANAYGHGAVEVALEIKDQVHGFAVATVKEALQLRESGVCNLILVLGYVCKAEYKTVIENQITFALLSKDMAEEVSACAKELNTIAKCHVKINTGMNRIGFPVNQASVEEISEIYQKEEIHCEGIFTHFATADELDKTFALEQFDLFQNLLDMLEKRGVVFEIRHCANSAAIVDLPQMKLDMVREGIILYGLKPSEEVDANMEYHRVMEIKSHVIAIRDVGAGEGISYGRTFITPHQMRIATIAIGYADGYPRSLSSKGYVLIHGKKAPVVGRVCMDLMMVDISGIEDVQVEDLATIVGRDGELEITIDELGMIADKFNYEFVCGISERVERKYVR